MNTQRRVVNQINIWAKHRSESDRVEMTELEKDIVAAWLRDDPNATWDSHIGELSKSILKTMWRSAINVYPRPEAVPDCEFCGDDEVENIIITSSQKEKYVCGTCAAAYTEAWEEAKQTVIAHYVTELGIPILPSADKTDLEIYSIYAEVWA